MERVSNSSMRYSASFVVPDFRLQNRDQGARGTCVAFSVIALMEYYFGYGKCLSPQFLYACCKMDDVNSGTSIAKAFDCIKEFGVCDYHVWPYNKVNVDPRNQAQIPPERLAEIPTEKCGDITPKRLFTPQNIEEYKSRLSGTAGTCPMPIVVGYQVFPRVNNNLDWVQMPLPGQKSDGAHAVLIYGWNDTPDERSKGYFLAQNSWGVADSLSSTPGLLKIPFEYIEQYAQDAWTIECSRKHPCSNAEEYAGMDEKRNELKLPSKNSLCFVDNTTPSPTVVLPPPPALDAVKKDFFGTQRKNISEQGYSLPGIGLSLLQRHGFKSEVNGRIFNGDSSEVNTKRSPELMTYIEHENPRSDLVAEIVTYRIPVHSNKCYLVASAFLYHVNLTAVLPSDIKLLEEFINDRIIPGWISHSIVHTFIIVGTFEHFHDSCQASSSPTVILCERERENIWKFKAPKCTNACTNEFLSHILPGDYVNEIQCAIYGPHAGHGHFNNLWWQKGIDGEITIESLSEKLQLHEDARGFGHLYCGIAKALDELFKSNIFEKRYGLMKSDKGGFQVIPACWSEDFAKVRKPYRFSMRLITVKRRCLIWSALSIICFVLTLALSLSPLVNRQQTCYGSKAVCIFVGLSGFAGLKFYIGRKKLLAKQIFR